MTTKTIHSYTLSTTKSNDIHLTAEQRIAKKFLWDLLMDGEKVPCDTGNGKFDVTIPLWFDLDKFNRGRKYFADNRLGIAVSNIAGVLTLLGEPKGLETVVGTTRTNSKEGATVRYIETIMHTNKWYEMDLSPGSASWRSLLQVRRMHLLASNASQTRKIGFITQAELSMTAFGFMGFPLIRPHLIGVRNDNDADREGLVHFWAVILFMIGVKDEFNMCLHPFPVVIEICYALLRYLFIPFMQLESTAFKELVGTMIESLSPFAPFMDYETQVFLLRRLAGVPGYQYGVDLDKEVLGDELYTAQECRMIGERMKRLPGAKFGVYEYALTHKVPVINIRTVYQRSYSIDGYTADIMGGGPPVNTEKPLHKHLGLATNQQLKVDYVDQSNWKYYLNDDKFYELSSKAQILVKMHVHVMNMYNYKIPRYLAECGYSYALYRMRKYHENYLKTAY